MQWMMNPLKALRYFLWEQYKSYLAKLVLIGIEFFVIGLFFHSMPVRFFFLHLYFCPDVFVCKLLNIFKKNQRRIQNPVKHLRLSLLRKQLTAFSCKLFLRKISISDV